MEFVFTPDKQVAEIKVPFYEDATEDFAPYYTVGITAHKPSSKSSVGEQTIKGQQQISIEMGKLGAMVTGFIPGIFGSANTKRYGYEIRFVYGQMQGVIKVAGLPMKSETSVKKGAVMIQALWNVRDWLKVAVTNRVFSPGSDMLIPFLLVDGKITVAEYIASRGTLPTLTAGSNVIDGEFSVVAG